MIFKSIKIDKNSVLNLSSVIHEVYSYSEKAKINEFWRNTLDSGFDYIVVRDMCCRDENLEFIYEDYDKIRRLADIGQIRDFESRFGNIHKRKNLIHYLLKYNYKSNWSREVKENYLPLSVDEMKSKFIGYTLVYCKEYVLPYTQCKIMCDFGIYLEDTTHVNMLFKRNS